MTNKKPEDDAENGGTGAAAASAAGRVLRDPKSSKDDKTAAGSDLAQVPKKPEK